jgi:hypothetical protein
MYDSSLAFYNRERASTVHTRDNTEKENNSDVVTPFLTSHIHSTFIYETIESKN